MIGSPTGHSPEWSPLSGFAFQFTMNVLNAFETARTDRKMPNYMDNKATSGVVSGKGQAGAVFECVITAEMREAGGKAILEAFPMPANLWLCGIAAEEAFKKMLALALPLSGTPPIAPSSGGTAEQRALTQGN